MNANSKILGSVCVVAVAAGIFSIPQNDDNSGSIRTANAAISAAPDPAMPNLDLGTFSTIELQSRITQMHINNTAAGKTIAAARDWGVSQRIYARSDTRATGLCYDADQPAGLKFYEC